MSVRSTDLSRLRLDTRPHYVSSGRGGGGLLEKGRAGKPDSGPPSLGAVSLGLAGHVAVLCGAPWECGLGTVAEGLEGDHPEAGWASFEGVGGCRSFIPPSYSQITRRYAEFSSALVSINQTELPTRMTMAAGPAQVQGRGRGASPWG